jgi:hypothetical protein
LPRRPSNALPLFFYPVPFFAALFSLMGGYLGLSLFQGV